MSKDRISVYKFGGASVKSAGAFRNLARIVQKNGGEQRLLLVVSAMGKTTNALEELLNLAYQHQDFEQAYLQLKMYHLEVLHELFSDHDHPVYQRLNHLFELLHLQLASMLPNDNFDKVYDQTVSFGELFLLQFYIIS
ncbi:hypothetical protein GCM10028895_43040 [Pontibacter rugosus]